MSSPPTASGNANVQGFPTFRRFRSRRRQCFQDYIGRVLPPLIREFPRKDYIYRASSSGDPYRRSLQLTVSAPTHAIGLFSRRKTDFRSAVGQVRQINVVLASSGTALTSENQRLPSIRRYTCGRHTLATSKYCRSPLKGCFLPRPLGVVAPQQLKDYIYWETRSRCDPLIPGNLRRQDYVYWGC